MNVTTPRTLQTKGVTLITGGSNGIGSSCARVFAAYVERWQWLGRNTP